MSAIQRLGVASTSSGIVQRSIEDTHGRGLVAAAHVVSFFIEPFGSERRHSLVGRKSFRLPSKVGQHILHRNTLAVCKEGLAFVVTAAIFVAYWFWRDAFLALVNHHFEQMDNSGEIAVADLFPATVRLLEPSPEAACFRVLFH